mmetsp:Transcript_24651/g.77446  ORF Transcript_24651/g.77446 Transcript_24651/m.77446 type:complete len:213 (+) Transcript_24651:655-1293(+)
MGQVHGPVQGPVHGPPRGYRQRTPGLADRDLPPPLFHQGWRRRRRKQRCVLRGLGRRARGQGRQRLSPARCLRTCEPGRPWRQLKRRDWHRRRPLPTERRRRGLPSGIVEPGGVPLSLQRRHEWRGHAARKQGRPVYICEDGMGGDFSGAGAAAAQALGGERDQQAGDETAGGGGEVRRQEEVADQHLPPEQVVIISGVDPKRGCPRRHLVE